MKTNKIINWLILFGKGSLMGIADLIPGVSGGTLALVLGIHSKLLNALKTLRPKSFFQPKMVSWFFLTAVVSGIVVSLALGAKIISHFLNDSNGLTTLHAIFFGLVVGSLFFCFSKVGRWTLKRIFLAFVGALMALSFVFWSQHQSPESHYSIPSSLHETEKIWIEFASHNLEKIKLSHLTTASIRNLIRHKQLDPRSWIYHEETNQMVLANSCLEFYNPSLIDYRLILCGIVAICAMLLPGISGSQVMIIFGYYHQVIHAIALWVPLFLKGQIFNDSFWILAQLGIGILIGLFLFSRFASYLYEKYPENFLSMLIGFMVGSLPAVWPFWKTYLDVQIALSGPYWKLEKVQPIFPSLADIQTWIALSLIAASILFLAVLRFVEKKRPHVST